MEHINGYQITDLGTGLSHFQTWIPDYARDTARYTVEPTRVEAVPFADGDSLN